jgi:hypothetical protein
MKKARILTVIVCVIAVANFASAETIRGIDIDFVTIGYAGNAGDTRGAGQGNYANPYGCGAVSYDYRIGKYEVTNAQWNAFTAIAGVPTGNDDGYRTSSRFTGDQQPTNSVSWYEAAQFCNYLTSGDKSKGVYQFSGNNTNPGNFLGINRDAAKATYGTIYFLPTEDEWYKAAYYTGGYCPRYSLYANGTDIAPVSRVNTNWGNNTVWNVGTGTQEQNGTFDMMGNLWEWTETLIGSGRSIRGGSYATDPLSGLGSNYRYGGVLPFGESGDAGFRVASTIPEPDTLLLHAPNGSESICAGTIYTISWSSTGSISNVIIEYSTNNGSSWATINNIPNTGSYNWLVPMVNSNQCFVRVSDASHPAICDISDNTFEITITKTITISSPNGGESLISGGEQLIQWSNTGTISGILIEYSVNNGLNWFPVAPANIGNSGSYEWLVPNYNSDQCLIRVSAVDATDVNDVSDNVFTIGPENPSEYPTLYEILGGSILLPVKEWCKVW